MRRRRPASGPLGGRATCLLATLGGGRRPPPPRPFGPGLERWRGSRSECGSGTEAASGGPETGLGGQNPRLEAPSAHRLLYRGSWGWRRRPLAPRLRPGEWGRPKGWKSGITRRGSSLPLPRPAGPGASCGGVTEERPGALGYRPFVPGARRSVGTSSVRDLRAWAAQPPAPRVVAGSGAGCRPDDGAEPPEGGGLGYAVVEGRARGGGGQLLRALGWRDPRPGRAAAPPNPKTRCARRPPHPAASPIRWGTWQGPEPSLGLNDSGPVLPVVQGSL